MLKTIVTRSALITFACSLSLSAYAMADGAKRMLHIPSGDLARALELLAKQAGADLVYRPDQVVGLKTSGVEGELSAEEAVTKLLEGTQLTLSMDASGAMLIAAPLPSGKADAASESSQPRKDTAAGPDEKTVALDEVIVTGTHIRGVAPTSPIITIDRTDIERSGYQSTAEVIRNLPQSFGGGYNATTVGAGGNSAQQNYSGSSSANLRGLGSDSTLTLVDGQRLAYTDYESAADISVIPLAAVERVEILTDGASAVYGSQAVAGVVNFILKKRYDGAEVSATYGDSTSGGGQLQRYSLIAGTDWGQGAGLISYERSEQDALSAGERSFNSPLIAQTSLLPQTRSDSFFARASHTMGPVELFAQGLYTRRTSDAILDFNDVFAGLLTYTNSDVEQHGVAAGGRFEIGDWHFSVSGNTARDASDNPLINLLDGALFLAVTQRFTTELQQVEVSADGTLFQLPTGAITLAVGASHRRETLAASQFSPDTVYADITADRHVESAYGEVNIPLVSPSETRRGLHALSASLAARLEDYNDFGSSTVPMAGVRYQPTKDLQIKATVGKSFRAPSLSQEFTSQNALLQVYSDPESPTGSSLVLVRTGGNAALTPEKSTAKTLNLVYAPAALRGASADLTFYRINYHNRIQNAFALTSSPLTDPAVAIFLQRDPTPAELDQILSESIFFNYAGQPYDPANIVATFDGRFRNESRQDVKGIDLLLRYPLVTRAGTLDVTLNGAYLDLQQKLTELTPIQQLSGTIYYPPKFRARAGASWEHSGWTASAFINHADSETDVNLTPSVAISSWTTVDAQVAYRFDNESWLNNTRVTLSAQNLLDRDPPFVNGTGTSFPGLHFDSTNASPLGRFVSVQLLKSWQ